MGFNLPVSFPLFPLHSLHQFDLDPAPSSASEVAKYIYIYFCFNLPPISPHPTSHCPSQSVPRPLFGEFPQAHGIFRIELPPSGGENLTNIFEQNS